jgi:hypothetical protein
VVLVDSQFLPVCMQAASNGARHWLLKSPTRSQACPRSVSRSTMRHFWPQGIQTFMDHANGKTLHAKLRPEQGGPRASSIITVVPI